jgi:hypothetical protein
MKLRHGQRCPRLGAHSRSISEVPGSLGQRYRWGGVRDPVAQFVALTGNGALSVLQGAIDAACAALAVVHVPTTVLDQFRLVVVSWQTDLSALPIALQAYLTADIQSAETYLKTLKRMIQSQQSAQIHR